jgi:hypothetical protein
MQAGNNIFQALYGIINISKIFVALKYDEHTKWNSNITYKGGSTVYTF